MERIKMQFGTTELNLSLPEAKDLYKKLGHKIDAAELKRGNLKSPTVSSGYLTKADFLNFFGQVHGDMSRADMLFSALVRESDPSRPGFNVPILVICADCKQSANAHKDGSGGCGRWDERHLLIEVDSLKHRAENFLSSGGPGIGKDMRDDLTLLVQHL